MPYPSYTKMSAGDVRAIRAYLDTVPAVRHAVEPDTLPFPFDIRAAMRAWDWLYFKPGEFKPDPQKSAEWNRGAYLVEGPGHCGACHTPKTVLGGDKASETLRGSPVQGWFAPSITNDGNAGLGRWSADDLVDYLKTGHNRFATATGPMAEEISHSTANFTDADLKSVAVYLKSLPGEEKPPAPVAAGDPVMVAGQAIYRDQCSACHGLDGRGTPHLFPSLVDAPSVRAHDPASLIRIVLRGARSVATPKEPTAPGMPSFAWQLNDAQVAAVLTYVRNVWKPSAAAVSADTVAKARTALSQRAE
jgi:mono/diheme cytochrome c family protein